MLYVPNDRSRSVLAHPLGYLSFSSSASCSTSGVRRPPTDRSKLSAQEQPAFRSSADTTLPPVVPYVGGVNLRGRAGRKSIFESRPRSYAPRQQGNVGQINCHGRIVSINARGTLHFRIVPLHPPPPPLPPPPFPSPGNLPAGGWRRSVAARRNLRLRSRKVAASKVEKSRQIAADDRSRFHKGRTKRNFSSHYISGRTDPYPRPRMPAV